MKIDTKHTLREAPVPMSTEFRTERRLEDRASQERLRKDNDFQIIEGVQRVLGPIQTLYRSGDVGDCHVAAANRWYRDYVLGVEGARDPEVGRSGKAPDAHASMLARVAACARHRGVREGLGFCAEARLRLLLVDELSFSAIAKKLMPNDVNGRKKIAAQFAFLLEQLAEHYQNVDRLRSARPPSQTYR